jgi:cell division protein FtsB
MARRKARMTLREMGITAGLCLLLVWLSVLVVGIFHKEQTARLTVADTRAQLAALDARKKTLSATVHELDTERGQEASLRETFGVTKPGEEVIVVVPKKDMPPPPAPTFWDRVKTFLHIR